jgi:hypothetical protein
MLLHHQQGWLTIRQPANGSGWRQQQQQIGKQQQRQGLARTRQHCFCITISSSLLQYRSFRSILQQQ